MVTPLSYFSDKLPYMKEAFVRLTGGEKTLEDLYKACGEKLAYQRYRECWSVIPASATLEELTVLSTTIKRALRREGKVISLKVCSGNTEFCYEGLNHGQMRQLLRCINIYISDLRFGGKQCQNS